MIDRTRMKQRAKHIRPLLPALILYIGLLGVASRWAPAMEASVWRYVVVLSPVVPGIFLAFGIVRVVSKLDEMERRIISEAVVFSFMSTMIFLLSVGLLGMVGVPQPRSVEIVAVMVVLLAVGKFWSNWRYR